MERAETGNRILTFFVLSNSRRLLKLSGTHSCLSLTCGFWFTGSRVEGTQWVGLWSQQATASLAPPLGSQLRAVLTGFLWERELWGSPSFESTWDKRSSKQISFLKSSVAYTFWILSVKAECCCCLFAESWPTLCDPGTAAGQAPLFSTVSWSLLKSASADLVMLSSYS